MKVYTKAVCYFQGSELTADREAMGLTQTEFAAKAGWSQQYQASLELPIGHAMNLRIEQGLKANKVTLEVQGTKY